MSDPMTPPDPYGYPTGGGDGAPHAPVPQPPPYDPNHPYGQQPYYGQPGPYGQPMPYFAVQRTTNGMAIASMVLGILWLYWIGSVLALVFGYIARRQIRERNQSGDGMAIAGIVLGWIGVGIFVLVFVVFLFGGIFSSTYS